MVMSFINQKGGVGKTTSTVNFAAALVKAGKKVLCIDADPQGNLSEYLGYQTDGGVTLSELMLQQAKIQSAIDQGSDDHPIDPLVAIRQSKEGIDYIPTNIALAGADLYLASVQCREMVLRNILRTKSLNCYEYVLIDGLPSLGIILTNVLTASDRLIIPVQAQKFALDGITSLEKACAMVKKNLNPSLKIFGVLLTMADNTSMSKAVEEELQRRYGDIFFRTKIHRLVEATNSTYDQKSLVNTKNSRLGAEYIAVTDELLARIDT